MHSKAIAPAMIALTIHLALVSAVAAQEVASIDLTKTTARMDLRRPKAKSAVGKGRTGEVRRKPCLDKTNPVGALRATVVSLDRTSYQVGDQPTFEITIENVGPAAVKIPFSPHLADLQPDNPALEFSYSELAVTMWIASEEWSTNTGGGATLYGSDNVPDTVLTLNPGEWARIIGKGNIDLSADASLIDRTRLGHAADHVYAEVSLHKVETLITATAMAELAREVCMTQRQGTTFPIRLTAP